MKLRRLLLPILAVASIAGLSACGKDGPQRTSESEGTYVTVSGLQYQVQISRQLNPTDTEDSGYLTGIPAQQAVLGPDDVWFGVFLRVKNDGHQVRRSAIHFVLQDTTGAVFGPIAGDNLVTYRPVILHPDELSPAPEEVAASGPTQGKLVLFKLKNATLNNRPLVLYITGPSGERGSVKIDV